MRSGVWIIFGLTVDWLPLPHVTVLNLRSQSSPWSHAASTAKSSTGTSSPGGAVSALASATTSEVKLVRFETLPVFSPYAAKRSLSLPGIDSEGHAANFVETEQIVQYNGAKASFIQVSLWNGKASKYQFLCSYAEPFVEGLLCFTNTRNFQSAFWCLHH